MMSKFPGWGGRAKSGGFGLFADKKGPWGPAGEAGDGDEPPSSSDGPPGPWGEPPKRGRRSSSAPGSNATSIEELLRRGRMRFGGGGGGNGLPSRSLVAWATLAFVLIWLVFTS